MAYTCITGSQHAHERGASPGLTSRMHHTELYTKLGFHSTFIPSEARLYLGSTEILSSLSTRSWPNNSDISTMVYGITVRLAGMKALNDSVPTALVAQGKQMLQ